MSSFDQLGISAERVVMLSAQGIKNPTPVQEAAIPLVLKDKDVIGQAQTGTGKTLAFVLPMLEKMNVKSDKVQGLIVTPTRELALQITEEVKRFIGPDEGIRVLAVYGGQDVEAQLAKLKGNMHLIIATPGRLLDHLRRETIQLFSVRTLVLDEADQMLHMGFLGEVEEILRNTPSHRQTLLFSATMPGAIRDLASRILRKPEEVTVRGKQVTVKEIRQLVIETSDRNKQAALKEMIDETRPYLGMIFCRTKRRASTLNEALQEAGYASDELHGDLSQAKREQVMKKFRDAKLQLLVATDIAARGLDVEGVTHVYNYDIPHDVESYIHRIGRTGRAGETGMAVTFVAPKDRPELAKIESGIDMGIERRTIGSSALAGGEGPAVRRAAGTGARGAGGGRREAGSTGGRSPGAGRGAGGRPAGAGRGGSGRAAGAGRGAGGAFDAGMAAEGPAFGKAAGGAAEGRASRSGGRAGGAEFGRGGRPAGGTGAEFGRGGRGAGGAGAVAGRDGRSGARGASAATARGRAGAGAAGEAGDRRTAAAEWPGYEVRPREPGGRSGGGKPGAGGRREAAGGGGRRGSAGARPGAEGGGRSAGGRSAGGRSAGGRSGPGAARGGRSPQGGGAGRGAGSPGRGSRGPGGRGGRSR